MTFFLHCLLAQLIFNAYFIIRLRRNKRIIKPLKYLLYSLVSLELLVYFTGFFFREKLPLEYFAFIQIVSAFWVIFSFYLIILLSIFDLIFYLKRKYFFFHKINRISLIIIEIIVFIAFFVYIGFHFQASKDRYLAPQIQHFSFELHASSNDSIEGKTNYKLLAVSDIHLGYIINKGVLQKYVDVINAQKADIIVIAGDLIDYYLEPLDAQKMDEDLRRLYAPLGVYFIPGNHEYKVDETADFEWIRKAGITVLRDSVVSIGNQLQLIGRDDRKNEEHRMDWNDLIAQTDSTKARVLIAHHPGDAKAGEKDNIPLIINGHSHDGQIFPVNWICRLLYPNSYGLQKKGNTCSYTTSGIGLSGFPFRIASESELVIFNLEIK